MVREPRPWEVGAGGRKDTAAGGYGALLTWAASSVRVDANHVGRSRNGRAPGALAAGRGVGVEEEGGAADEDEFHDKRWWWGCLQSSIHQSLTFLAMLKHG